MTTYVLGGCRFTDERFVGIREFQGNICRNSALSPVFFECRPNVRPPRPDESDGKHEKNRAEKYRDTDRPSHAPPRGRSGCRPLQLETDYNPCVLIGERIRAIREGKNLSQGDVEKRSGLLRVYVSRVENGHVIPALESLEKFARALEVPLYQLFYEAEEPPDAPPLLKRKTAEEAGMTRKEIRFWEKLRHLLARMKESDRRLVLRLAQKMAGR